MIKGCQREMIVMQTQESALFESAYFILRREHRPAAGSDMVAEANRIISAGEGRFGGDLRERKRRRWGRFLLFLGGFLSGSGLFALLWLLL